MRASYDKLWVLLKERKMTREEMRILIKMSPNTLAKMGKNENVSMDVLQRICKLLKCNIGDIVDFIPEDDEE